MLIIPKVISKKIGRFFLVCWLLWQHSTLIWSQNTVLNHEKGVLLLHIAGKDVASQNDNLLTAFEKAIGKFSTRQKVVPIQFRPIAPDFPFYRLEFDSNIYDETLILNYLRQQTNVLAVQFNHQIAEERAVNKRVNDPLYAQQWGLDTVQASKVWESTVGGLTPCGDTIVVAILDNGFDIEHEDLKANIWNNNQEIPNNEIDDDQNGYIDDVSGWNPATSTDSLVPQNHGTSCASVLGAVGNNGKGMVGINWHIKMMLLGNANTEEYMVANYLYALKMRQLYEESKGKKGAFVALTSLSAGFRRGRAIDFPLLCGVYDSLGKHGILSVTAADNVNGNVENIGDIPTLCTSPYTIVVTNSTQADERAVSGGYSEKFVDLAAPATEVPLATINNTYDTNTGTSFATPLVAGAVALLYSDPQGRFCHELRTNPSALALQIKEVILNGVDIRPTLTGKTVSNGRLNVFNSFQLLRRANGMPIGDWKIQSIAPNPQQINKDLRVTLQVPLQYEGVWFRLSDMLGRVVYQRPLQATDVESQQMTLSTNSLQGGIYTISLLQQNGQVLTSENFVIINP